MWWQHEPGATVGATCTSCTVNLLAIDMHRRSALVKLPTGNWDRAPNEVSSLLFLGPSQVSLLLLLWKATWKTCSESPSPPTLGRITGCNLMKSFNPAVSFLRWVQSCNTLFSPPLCQMRHSVKSKRRGKMKPQGCQSLDPTAETFKNFLVPLNEEI